MNQETIEQNRRQLASKLRPWLKAERVSFDQTALPCPVCGKRALFNERNALGQRRTEGRGDWDCPHCGADGDVVDYALCSYPYMDESEAIRHIRRVLGMKNTYLEVISGNDLMDLELPRAGYLVERVLGKGVWLLAGDSKIGKSWLVLTIAAAVSRGEKLWGLRTDKGEVLYLSLEDSPQNIQQRLNRVTGGQADGILVATEAELLGSGLEEQLSRILSARPAIRLVVIDTLQRVRQAGSEPYSYAGDYSAIACFKSICARFNCCILLVHHTRKQEAADVYDMISGTTGLMGSADGAMILHKKTRQDAEAVLAVTSRVMPAVRLLLHQDEDMRWVLTDFMDDAPKRRRDPVLEAVARLAAERGGFRGSATDLFAALPPFDGLPNAQVLSRRLNACRSELEQDYALSFRQAKLHGVRSLVITPLTEEGDARGRKGTQGDAFERAAGS